MLGQLNMYGMDRVETAIERLKATPTDQAEQARQNINQTLGINARWDDVQDDLPF